MKLLLIALTLCCSLFFSTVAPAEKNEQKVHLIYAGDQSGSMLMSHKPSWLSAQRHFLTEYFSGYSKRCQELHVDYIAWGSEPLPPLSVVLRTNNDGNEFSELLDVLLHRNLQSTIQHKAMLAAVSLVTQNFDRTIIIFTSDEFVASEKDAELWKLVPENVEFIGIALGSNGVRDYFEQHIVPANGKLYHAGSTKEFGEILYSIFDELAFDHCLAS